MVQSFLKQQKITKRYDQHHMRPIHDAITRHHPPIPAPSLVEILHAKHHKHYLEKHLNGKAEYTNTQKTYPSKRKTLPLIIQGFWLVGLFAKKLLSSESLLSHFSSCSSSNNH
jgi:hypothetical protein